MKKTMAFLLLTGSLSQALDIEKESLGEPRHTTSTLNEWKHRLEADVIRPTLDTCRVRNPDEANERTNIWINNLSNMIIPYVGAYTDSGDFKSSRKIISSYIEDLYVRGEKRTLKYSVVNTGSEGEINSYSYYIKQMEVSLTNVFKDSEEIPLSPKTPPQKPEATPVAPTAASQPTEGAPLSPRQAETVPILSTTSPQQTEESPVTPIASVQQAKQQTEESPVIPIASVQQIDPVALGNSASSPQQVEAANIEATDLLKEKPVQAQTRSVDLFEHYRKLALEYCQKKAKLYISVLNAQKKLIKLRDANKDRISSIVREIPYEKLAGVDNKKRDNNIVDTSDEIVNALKEKHLKWSLRVHELSRN